MKVKVVFFVNEVFGSFRIAGESMRDLSIRLLFSSELPAVPLRIFPTG